MTRINVRGLIGKDVIPDLSSDKIVELRKLELDIERIKANKLLDGEHLYYDRAVKAWIICIVSIFTLILCFFSIPKIVLQRLAIKNGYCLVSGNMINKENVPLALNYKFAKDLADNGKILLSIPYLNTYVGDDKQKVAVNEQILTYLKTLPKEIPKEVIKVEVPKK